MGLACLPAEANFQDKPYTRNSENLLRLIYQLLDFSKLEPGTMPPNLVRHDINVYLQYLVESFYQAARLRR